MGFSPFKKGCLHPGVIWGPGHSEASTLTAMRELWAAPFAFPFHSEIQGSPAGRCTATQWLDFLAAAFYTLMLNIVTSEAANIRRQKKAGFSILHSATFLLVRIEGKKAQLSTSPTTKSVGKSQRCCPAEEHSGLLCARHGERRKGVLVRQQSQLIVFTNNIR